MAIQQDFCRQKLLNSSNMNLELFTKNENLNETGETICSSAEIIENKNCDEITDFKPIENINYSLDFWEKFDYNQIESLEILHDREMVEHIADYTYSIEELRYDNWQKMSLNQKIELLNIVEQEIAKIEHRPPMIVDAEIMETNVFGYQDQDNQRIAINADYLSSNELNHYKETLDTIIHEGRHAYQHYNVDVQMIHESWAEVNTWRENFYNPELQYYHSTGQKIFIPTYNGYQTISDFRLYYYQPVEIDARNFTTDIMDRLDQKGFFNQ